MVGYDIFDKITYVLIGLVFGILLVPCVYFLGGLLSGVAYTFSNQLNETSHCLQQVIDFSSNLESVHETVAQAANDTRICTMSPLPLPLTQRSQSVTSEATAFLQLFQSVSSFLFVYRSTTHIYTPSNPLSPPPRSHCKSSSVSPPSHCEYNCTFCPFCSRQAAALKRQIKAVDSILNTYNDSVSPAEASHAVFSVSLAPQLHR